RIALRHRPALGLAEDGKTRGHSRFAQNRIAGRTESRGQPRHRRRNLRGPVRRQPLVTLVERRTAWALRVHRLLRVGAHVVEGILTTTVVFPWIERSKQNALIRRWSQRLLRMLHIEPRVHGVLSQTVAGNLLIV